MTGRDIWVDYTLSDITEVCEQRYGKIELTDYDFQTGLYERYVPEKHAGQRMRSYYMIFARNDLIVNRIADSNHSKIAVVYGAGHSFGVVYFLKKAHGFRADKRYKAEQEL